MIKSIMGFSTSVILRELYGLLVYFNPFLGFV